MAENHEKTMLYVFCLFTSLYRCFRLSRVSQTQEREEIYRLVSKIINFTTCGSLFDRFCVLWKNIVEPPSKIYIKCMKISENLWKSMKIYEIYENLWKSMKIIENHRKSSKIIENHRKCTGYGVQGTGYEVGTGYGVWGPRNLKTKMFLKSCDFSLNSIWQSSLFSFRMYTDGSIGDPGTGYRVRNTQPWVG